LSTARFDRATLRAIPPGIWALGFVSLLMDASSEMIHALLPIYLVTVMGTSATWVGVIEGIAEATASVTKVFSGALSDRLGNRKLLTTVGYTLAALSKPIFPLAPTVGWLVAARFIDRLGKGIRGAPRDALIADIAPAHLRGSSFGLRQSLDTVGAFIGPLLAIGLMSITAGDFQAVFWVAVIPAFLAVALMIFAVHEPKRTSPAPSAISPLRSSELARLGRSYWLIVGVATVFTLARFSEAFLILRAQAVGVPITLVPAVLVVMNMIFTLGAYQAGVIADARGRYGVLVIGIALLIAADLILAFPPSILGVALGVAVWGLHLAFTQGVLTTLVADKAPAELRGTAFGFFHLLTGGALLCASVLAGVLWDVLGPQATYLAGACIAAISLLGVFAIRQHLRREQIGQGVSAPAPP